MDLSMIINLVAGVLGGNGAGSILKKYSLGTVGNSIVGLLGGGLGGKLLGMLGLGAVAASGTGDGGLDVTSIVSSLASGGVGGGVLMTIIGVVKNMMNKS